MTTKEDRVAAIDVAIERGGGIVRFAKAMNVSHQAVYNWKARGWVPPERAVLIEGTFGVDRDRLMNPFLVRAINAPAADIL